MVHAFYGSSYATCLQQLEALRPQLALDMHLAVSHTSSSLHKSSARQLAASHIAAWVPLAKAAVLTSGMPWLQAHVEPLYSAIRSKALIQYVTPFTSVNLATMATAFATTVGCAVTHWSSFHVPLLSPLPAEHYAMNIPLL
jgi:hypothetical protein